MRHLTRKRTLLAFLLAAAALLAFPVPADEKQHDAGGPELEAAMAAMEAAARPGEHHEFLAALEGEWTFTSKMWMDPAEPPEESPGESTKTMIMDGRYLQEEARGSAAGQEFHGRGVIAYDNTAGEYINTWIDSMGTSISIVRGQREGNTLTLHGEYLNPMDKERMKVRYVTRVVDKDHHVFQYFMTAPGAEEFKSMEIEYVRKGAE